MSVLDVGCVLSFDCGGITRFSYTQHTYIDTCIPT